MYPCFKQVLYSKYHSVKIATYVIPSTQFNALMFHALMFTHSCSRMRLWDKTGQRHFILHD